MGSVLRRGYWNLSDFPRTEEKCGDGYPMGTPHLGMLVKQFGSRGDRSPFISIHGNGPSVCRKSGSPMASWVNVPIIYFCVIKCPHT